MKLINKIKTAYFVCLDLIGTNRLAFEKKKPSITILTYHSVVPDNAPIDLYEYRNAVSVSAFEQQIIFLKKNFEVISLKDVLQLFTKGEITQNYVVITFDDGYKNNYDYAFPVLKKLNVSGAFFITTSLIGTSECLWTDWVTFLFFKSHESKIRFKIEDQWFEFPLKSDEDRVKASQTMRNWMKSLPSSRIKKIVSQLKNLTKVDSHPVKEDPIRYAFMDWEHVRKMDEQGMEIGSHTHSHFLLSMLTNKQVEKELTLSKQLIENHIGKTCTIFSYPNGQEKDFNNDHILILKKLGYQLALTQIPGYNTIETDLFRLKRINITNKMSLPIFKAYVCGSRTKK